MVQSFYAYRIYVLSQSRVITAIIVFVRDITPQVFLKKIDNIT